ncbi:hypothetical protein [Streptomyces sp. NBRC 110028]|uniref:hypothetical protein n=1 Tax=Streptomyces sp. NBRC 110028 TaxID=1621260 RepID=UPI0006E43F5D|nr:hypothetical protein [Streptomyces sp. NBRC 110028]
MKTKRIGQFALFGVLVASASVLTAQLISSSPEETSVGKAPSHGPPANVPTLKDGKILPAGEWPDACSLMTQEDIAAILPDAEEIRQTDRPIPARSIKEFRADSSWKPSDRAPSGECDYVMWLPGETYSATQAWIRIDAVADPKLIARYFESGVPGTPGGSTDGADKCVMAFAFDQNWTCRKGPLLFTVGGQTTATFEGMPDAAPFAWRDKVTPELVRTVAAKIT